MAGMHRQHKGENFYLCFWNHKAAAGGMENFVKIDYGINYDAAKAANAAGVKTYVLVSSGGANSKSRFPYLRSKGKLDDDVIALKFDRTIILRPGALLGERKESKDIVNRLVTIVFTFLKYTPLSMGSCYDHEVARAV